MVHFSSLAMSITWLVVCVDSSPVRADAAPVMVTEIGSRALVFGPQAEQAGLHIAEYGERIRGSFHFDDNGHVSGVSLHNCSVTSNDIKLISRIDGLKSLSFDSFDFRGIDLSPLSSVTSIESVSVYDSNITDSQLAFLGTLPKLTVIDIRKCELAGDFLSKIRTPQGVKIFTLSGINGLKGSNISEFLRLATAIKSLHLEADGLVDGDLKEFGKLTRCSYVRLTDNNKLTNNILMQIQLMASMTILNLTGTSVGDGAVQGLSRLSDLAILKLANSSIGNGLKNLAGLEKLEELDLASTRLGDEGLRGIVKSRNIKHLDLSNTLVTDRGMMEMGGLQSLEVLKLSNLKVSDGSLHALTALKNLVRLDLSGTPISDGIGEIVKRLSLAHLNLAGTRVGDAGVEWIAQCATLATLDLSGTRVHDHGVSHLARLGSLQELNLANTEVGDGVVRALETCPDLLLLNLARTRVGDDALPHLAGISYLTLAGTSVTARGLLGLVSRKDKRPNWIDITGTGIESVGNIKPVRQGDRMVLIAPFRP